MRLLMTIGLLIIGMGLSAQVYYNSTTRSGSGATAIGYKTTASGYNGAVAMGEQTVASGNLSTAMGYKTTASGDYSVSIGQWNKSNAAFVIGNGTDANSLSDAFKVMTNGDATVSKDLTVNGVVNTSSDARLKTDIMSLGGTLAKLLLIDGKSYTTKKDGRQTIGVLAQEIQKVFPELVTIDDNDMLAVNYQGLVPVLINALKEQDEKVKEQEVILQAQEERLARLDSVFVTNYKPITLTSSTLDISSSYHIVNINQNCDLKYINLSPIIEAGTSLNLFFVFNKSTNFKVSFKKGGNIDFEEDINENKHISLVYINNEWYKKL